METIEQEWKEFWDAVVTPSISKVQEREMKRAFFSGALIVYLQLDEASKATTETEERNAAKHLEGCMEETITFCRKIAEEF